jgi:hypothetical protein
MAHQITISWNASPPPISGYNIRRGTAAGNESATPLNAVPIVGTSYTDNTVFAGQIYSYEITAVFNGVESAESLGVLSVPVPFNISPLALDFGAAASFGILAGSTVTNVPGSNTMISGDVGVSPGTSITGFGPPASISGVFHAGDFVSAAAESAVQAAFANGMSIAGGTAIPADIGGSVLVPGVYVASSSLAITGNVVLDAQGNPNAVFIFQIGSTLSTAVSNSAVVLQGGALADNVFWLVGSSATLNNDTSFTGNILAQASITVGTGVNISGRLLAISGAVTLNGSEVIVFESGSLAIWNANTQFFLGQLIFDGHAYQVVTVAGTSGGVPPAWQDAPGSSTQDGSVTWSVITAVGDVVILKGLPPSLPNVPPAPPVAPTNVHISSES